MQRAIGGKMRRMGYVFIKEMGRFREEMKARKEMKARTVTSDKRTSRPGPFRLAPLHNGVPAASTIDRKIEELNQCEDILKVVNLLLRCRKEKEYGILAHIALKCDDVQARKAAIGMIDDPTVLLGISEWKSVLRGYLDTKRAAREKLRRMSIEQGIKISKIKPADINDIRYGTMESIFGSLSKEDETQRRFIDEKIDMLNTCLGTSNIVEVVNLLAACRDTDQEYILAHIALKCDDVQTRKAAIGMINDKGVLAAIAQWNGTRRGYSDIKMTASQKLRSLTEAKGIGVRGIKAANINDIKPEDMERLFAPLSKEDKTHDPSAGPTSTLA